MNVYGVETLCAHGCQGDVGVVNLSGTQHEIDFVVNFQEPLHTRSDGILQVGAIPFLLDKAILDTALAD